MMQRGLAAVLGAGLALAFACAGVVGASPEPVGFGLGGEAAGRRCVGVFVTNERRTVAGDISQLVVVGDPPCPAAAWTTLGVYRALDDGAVEFLASPIPPCPDGSGGFVSIRFPNP